MFYLIAIKSETNPIPALPAPPTVLVLRPTRVLHADGELPRVGVEADARAHAVRGGYARVPGHAVQCLGQVGGALQDDLLQAESGCSKATVTEICRMLIKLRVTTPRIGKCVAVT